MRYLKMGFKMEKVQNPSLQGKKRFYVLLKQTSFSSVLLVVWRMQNCLMWERQRTAQVESKIQLFTDNFSYPFTQSIFILLNGYITPGWTALDMRLKITVPFISSPVLPSSYGVRNPKSIPGNTSAWWTKKNKWSCRNLSLGRELLIPQYQTDIKVLKYVITAWCSTDSSTPMDP